MLSQSKIVSYTLINSTQPGKLYYVIIIFYHYTTKQHTNILKMDVV